MSKLKKEYISKRLLARGSRRIFKKDANKALKENGYVIVVKDGWVVKESINGDIERIRKINSSGISQNLLLD
ncbi:MAG: hypothetical protein N4A59_11940 [Marinifilum sp.]|jgi:hypothetical protein|nr:hypothetical protein [Marinifilum sp.]